MKSDYYFKYKNIIPKNFFSIKNISILEFGVERGNTTELFLNMCKIQGGRLHSVDIKDYSKLFKSKNWNFLKSDDQDFKRVKNFIKKKNFDIICLDTIHTEKHVKKILINYFKYLKIGGIFLIDGISHIPYVKNSYRNNFFSEINNKEIFNFILNLINNKKNKIEINFSFVGSGVARIAKFKNVKLEEKKIISRTFSLKNIIRKLFI